MCSSRVLKPVLISRRPGGDGPPYYTCPSNTPQHCIFHPTSITRKSRHVDVSANHQSLGERNGTERNFVVTRFERHAFRIVLGGPGVDRRDGLPFGLSRYACCSPILANEDVLDDSLAAPRLFEATTPKALESMIDLYAKPKERKALEKLLEDRRSTYSDFEQLNSSKKRVLDELIEEMEMIKAVKRRGRSCQRERPSEVKETGIAVSASPVTTHNGATAAVAVTGLSISVSPSPAETDLSSLPPGRASTKDS